MAPRRPRQILSSGSAAVKTAKKSEISKKSAGDRFDVKKSRNAKKSKIAKTVARAQSGGHAAGLENNHSDPDQLPFPFMQLPAEIRNMIYGHVLVQPNGVVRFGWRGSSNNNVVDMLSSMPGLLMANHQIRVEAQAVHFAQTRVELNLADSVVRGCLDNLRRVNKGLRNRGASGDPLADEGNPVHRVLQFHDILVCMRPIHLRWIPEQLDTFLTAMQQREKLPNTRLTLDLGRIFSWANYTKYREENEKSGKKMLKMLSSHLETSNVGLHLRYERVSGFKPTELLREFQALCDAHGITLEAQGRHEGLGGLTWM